MFPVVIMAETEIPTQKVLEKYSVKIISTRTCTHHLSTCNISGYWGQEFDLSGSRIAIGHVTT